MVRVKLKSRNVFMVHVLHKNCILMGIPFHSPTCRIFLSLSTNENHFRKAFDTYQSEQWRVFYHGMEGQRNLHILSGHA